MDAAGPAADEADEALEAVMAIWPDLLRPAAADGGVHTVKLPGIHLLLAFQLPRDDAPPDFWFSGEPRVEAAETALAQQLVEIKSSGAGDDRGALLFEVITWALELSERGLGSLSQGADAPGDEAKNTDLQAFRDSWQRELEQVSGSSSHGGGGGGGGGDNSSNIDSAPIEQPVADTPSDLPPLINMGATVESDSIQQAVQWHLQAEELEAKGQVPEAMILYRKAARIDPNIEHRAFEYREERAVSADGTNVDIALRGDEPAAEQTITDLKEHFRTMPMEWQYRVAPRTGIDAIPVEVLVKILVYLFMSTWNVGKIRRLGQVCSAMYKVLLDEDLWRQIGRLIWGGTFGVDDDDGNIVARTPSARQVELWGSLREMCVVRPRLLFHGVYISMYRYRRQGERSWESFYTPTHTVEYFRYLRFFPDGCTLYITTPEPPNVVVPKLKHPGGAHDLSGGIFSGTYKLGSNGLALVTARKDSESSTLPGRRSEERSTLLAELSLRIEHRSSTFSTRLCVTSYATTVVRDGVHQSAIQSTRDILPFIFSPIKSLQVHG